ncbi:MULTISPECIES: hypothetical protein [Natrialbaceae]|uniref:hypothetical protein n=1 Tax=Natrialbaceae TaxID=1644061 RepID=UPI00207C6A39|nr:hypothetical protein [Natronococcus sp. CG52]
MLVAVPLLFIIVSEFSSIARNIDLEKAVDEEWDQFQFFESTESILETYVNFLESYLPIGNMVTNLGRFVLVHYLNISVIFGGILILIFLPDQNIATQISIGLLILLHAFLPIIEVSKYDRLLEKGVSPRSFSTHISISMLLLISTVSSGFWIHFPSQYQYLNIFALVLGIILAIVLSKVFVNSLQKDVEKLCAKKKKNRTGVYRRNISQEKPNQMTID